MRRRGRMRRDSERDRLRKFAEFVAGYESEQQLVGSGVIAKAKKVLVDACPHTEEE